MLQLCLPGGKRNSDIKLSMRIKISRHILRDKIPFFEKQGFKISVKQIKDVIKNPEHTDEESDSPKIIVSKGFDERYIIRVVYKVRKDDGIIKAITFYLAEKGRYY